MVPNRSFCGVRGGDDGAIIIWESAWTSSPTPREAPLNTGTWHLVVLVLMKNNQTTNGVLFQIWIYNSWKTRHESTYHALYLVEIHKKTRWRSTFLLASVYLRKIHLFNWDFEPNSNCLHGVWCSSGISQKKGNSPSIGRWTLFLLTRYQKMTWFYGYVSLVDFWKIL